MLMNDDPTRIPDLHNIYSTMAFTLLVMPFEKHCSIASPKLQKDLTVPPHPPLFPRRVQP